MILLWLFALAIAGVLALFGLDLLVRRTVPGVWLVLMLVVLEALVDSDVISLQLAGFRVSLADLGFSLLALAAVLRLVRGRLSREQGLLVFLAGLALISLILGMTSGALESAVNEFRGYLAFLAAALYASTVPLDRETRGSLVEAWFWAGMAMGGVVLLRWAGRIGGVDLGVFDATYDATIRVLDGPQSLFVASAAVILLLSGLQRVVERPRLYTWAGAALLLIAIVLNRRTVWLALAVALVVLLIRERRIGKRAATAAVAGLAFFTLVVPLFSEAQAEGDTAAQSATDVGTLLWRFEGWTDLVESGPQEPADYLIGLPFGSGYERTISGNVRDSNPHSYYVQTFLRTGLVGIGILLLLLWLVFSKLWRRPAEERMPLSSNLLVMLLIMMGVWFLTWPPYAEQGIILGLATAIAGNSSTTFSWGRSRRALSTTSG